MTIDPHGPVVITGASTGIGRAIALHLDARGFTVYAGVRRDSDGAALADASTGRLRPVLIDVTDHDSIHAAVESISQKGDGLAGLVNNAGIAASGPLEYLPINNLRSVMEVNVTGQLAVTQAFLPLIRQGQGRIVFNSSIMGRVPIPLVGAYVASKYALEGMADVLRQELLPWKIPVSLLEAGPVQTPLWVKGYEDFDTMTAELSPEGLDRYGKIIVNFRKLTEPLIASGLPPERVAQTVEHALTARNPKTRYLLGREARIQAALRSLLSDRMFARLIMSRLRRG